MTAARPRRPLAPAGLAALGAWLVAKQVWWSPAVQAGEPLRPGALAASAAFALLVLALALRVDGRARAVALLAADALLTLTYQVHLLYHRQFHELASVAALPFASQAAGVAGAVRTLFRAGDLLLWLDVAILAAAAAAGARGAPARPRGARALALAAALLLAGALAPLVYRPLTGPLRLGVARAEVAAELNVVGYQLYDLATWARRRLGAPARPDLDALVAYHRAGPPARGPLTGVARGRNVVVVQLESFQGFALGHRVNGAPVTPRLDALARESLVFTRALSQVGQGTTSDAELLAGCSLHPLEAGAAFTSRYDVDYRCLPELLAEAGYRTVAMHANWPNFWNRDRMYPAMGFQEFRSIRDFDRAPVVGLGLSDARFVEQAAERLAGLPEPFHAVLVTLSNHAPFPDPAIPRTLPLGDLRDTDVGGYLDSVAFTDAAVGALVERLRASGLLDRSILVVYGDHQGLTRDASGTGALGLPARPDATLLHERRIPLLVRLPGGRHAGARDAPAGQVDVAPTLLDLLGLSPEGAFLHGRSLVSAPPAPVVLPDGSAVAEDLTWLGPEGRWGAPRTCLDSGTGAVVAAERCAALAAHAARALAVSRAEVDGDLFRWMAPRPPVAVRAVSSPPHLVSGDRALVEVDAPGDARDCARSSRTGLRLVGPAARPAAPPP